MLESEFERRGFRLVSLTDLRDHPLVAGDDLAEFYAARAFVRSAEGEPHHAAS